MTIGPVRRSCVGCGARLAGDNPATVCGPCQQDAAAGRRPPPLGSRVWSSVEVRAACRRQHFGELIRAYRYLAGSKSRPPSQEQVADWLGVTQPQLSRIETGPPVTDLSRLIRWATTLGIPPELLWFRTDYTDHSTAATTGTRPAVGGPRSRSVVLSVELDRSGGQGAGTHPSLPAELAGRVERPASGPVTGALRVGIIAPPWVPVPPPAYGGTELVIDVLARGLAARGHEVLLFATGDSTCDVKRLWQYPVAFGNGIGTTAIELNHTAAAYAALAGCDIVHDHTLAGLYVSQTDPAMPVVTTNHGPFSAPELADVYRRTAHRVPVIAISEDQAAAAGPAGIAVAATIHHGLDLDAYRYNPHSGDYVAVLGRMHPDKGIDRAITLAREAGVKVKVAAKMREPAEHAYYRNMIEPLLGGPGVEYIGEVGHDAKIELLSGARALLNPVRWPEPFGLVNVEALACGTPVVATDRGALPELVAHGETGYIAASDTGLVEALDKIDCIDRSVCRHQAETRFSMQRMAADHETLYRQVIAAWPTGGHQARERR